MRSQHPRAHQGDDDHEGRRDPLFNVPVQRAHSASSAMR